MANARNESTANAASDESRTVLVLAGAVAKGAFEAGALEVLHQRGLRFARIVGASSGALNAAYWAAATRAGREDDAAKGIASLWLERANLGVFSLTLNGILSERGFSTIDRISALLEAAVGPWLPGARHPAELRVVVTPLSGVDGEIGSSRATTYQHVLRFDHTAFDTAESRQKVFRAAAASGAFPGAFVPVELEGLGACVDGGAVNNTPIKEAISGGKIDRVVVVTPHPLITSTPGRPNGGLQLLGRLFDILVNERLYRDLREAETVNAQLLGLERLRAAGALDAGQLNEVKRAVNLGEARQLEIIQVRPVQELPGNPFSGFFSRELREAYIGSGREAAKEACKGVDFKSAAAAKS